MALKIGDKAPEFSLLDTDKKLRSLKEFLGKKTVLAFFPGAFTGVCDKELCMFRDLLTVLGTVNAKVVGISVDSPFANKGFADRYTLGFPLLSDYLRQVIPMYGGIQVDFAGIPGYMAAKRAVFVLDPDGVITYLWVSDNPGVEPNYEEVRKAVAS